jgi:hypothetical protein
MGFLVKPPDLIVEFKAPAVAWSSRVDGLEASG